MVAAFLILCYLTIRAEGITLKLEVTKSTLISFRRSAGLSLEQKGFVGPLATNGLSPGTALDCNDVGSWYDVLWEEGREYQSPNAGPRVPMARPSSRILIPVPWSSLNRVE